jgi:hypothetical protein
MRATKLALASGRPSHNASGRFLKTAQMQWGEKGFSTTSFTRQSRVSSYLTISNLPGRLHEPHLFRFRRYVFCCTFPRLIKTKDRDLSRSFGSIISWLLLATSYFDKFCNLKDVRTFLPRTFHYYSRLFKLLFIRPFSWP